jgi:hypothetical protein
MSHADTQEPKQTTGSALLMTALISLAAIVLSHLITKWALPSAFRLWGITLFGILGVWSAVSLRTIWFVISKPIQWLVIAIIGAAVVGGLWLPDAGYRAAFQLIPLAVVVLVLIAGASAVSGLFARVRLLRFRLSPKAFWPGFTMMLAGVTMLTTANLRHSWQTPLPVASLDTLQQLRYLHATDQQDRRTGRFLLDSNRDKARLQRVLELDRTHAIKAPEEQYHAALILQHGHSAQHYQRAYELFAAAARADIPEARSLSHAAYDRWMLSIGKPQKYGTQLMVVQ